MNEKIVLASASPRRIELLKQIGIDAQVLPVEVAEVLEGESPAWVVEKNAKLKLEAAIKLCPNQTIIAADTVVYLNNQILGKPTSEANAYSILKFLSGKTHSVFTAVGVAYENQIKCKVVETKVKFGVLTTTEIWDYINTKEPMDKAGAYAIQGKGALFVEEICGDYTNVVGLPLFALKSLLPLNGIISWRGSVN